MKRILWKCLVLSVLITDAHIFAADQSTDEAAIRALEARQPEAWNHHDAKAYANLFTEDGDCVNIVGWWWKGRAEIERKLTDADVYVSKVSVHNYECGRSIPHAGDGSRACSLDHDRRENPNRIAGATTGASDARSSKTKRPVVDRRISKYTFGAEMPFLKGPVAPPNVKPTP